MNTRSWLTLLFLAFTSALLAQSQFEMNETAEREAAKADKELNQVYRKVLGSLDAEGAKLLKESQRAWIAYRDAEAKFAADEARGGSMAPMLYSGTLATLTKERVKRLKQGSESADDDLATQAKALGDKAKAMVGRVESESEAHQKRLPERLEANRASKDDGAGTRHQVAQAFFEAYRTHNRKAALAVATGKVIGKLVWDKDAGDNPTLKLLDDSHIHYEGGTIELKMEKTQAGRWLVSDVGVTAD